MGSKPALITSALIWILITLTWALVAGGIFRLNLNLIVALQFLMGFAMSTFNMSNVRLAMVTSPVMGRTHFFALFSVVANVTLGLAPVVWGLVIDTFATTNYPIRGVTLNRYTIFYMGCLLLFGVTVILMRRVDEPKAARVEELIRQILITSPQRFWARLLTRL